MVQPWAPISWPGRQAGIWGASGQSVGAEGTVDMVAGAVGVTVVEVAGGPPSVDESVQAMSRAKHATAMGCARCMGLLQRTPPDDDGRLSGVGPAVLRISRMGAKRGRWAEV